MKRSSSAYLQRVHHQFPNLGHKIINFNVVASSEYILKLFQRGVHLVLQSQGGAGLYPNGFKMLRMTHPDVGLFKINTDNKYIVFTCLGFQSVGIPQTVAKLYLNK